MTATVTFNGLNLDVEPFHVQNIEGLAGSPDVRIADRSLVARNGMLPGQDYLAGRTITITLDVTSTVDATFDAAIEDLSEAFAVGADEAPLTFQIRGIAGGNQARVNVRPRRMSLPLPATYFLEVAEAVVELFATDPLIYSNASTITTIGLAFAGGGATFPLTFDLVFGTAGDTGLQMVTNAGNATSYPSFRVYGPVTNPTLRSETLDQAVTVGIDLLAGEYLDVDMAQRTVLLNGTANRYSLLTKAEWWGLAPGANTVRYSATVTTSSTADMTWRSAWV